MNLRTIYLGEGSRSDGLHIEIPGGIVNIYHKLRNMDGGRVVAIQIIADGDRYPGEERWWIESEDQRGEMVVRLVQGVEPHQNTELLLRRDM